LAWKKAEWEHQESMAQISKGCPECNCPENVLTQEECNIKIAQVSSNEPPPQKDPIPTEVILGGVGLLALAIYLVFKRITKRIPNNTEPFIPPTEKPPKVVVEEDGDDPF
jgi:hypothetical protein